MDPARRVAQRQRSAVYLADPPAANLAVLLVGAALALSGAIMQALFENPLAEPGLLGVSNGAGVGLIAAVLLGKGVLPGWALGLCAIFGALLITFILLRFARRHLSTSRLLLAGGGAGIICSALMTGQSTSPPLLTCVS